MKESEQHRFENMRSLLDDKARELTLLQKQLRQQIARLVSLLFVFFCAKLTVISRGDCIIYWITILFYYFKFEEALTFLHYQVPSVTLK